MLTVDLVLHDRLQAEDYIHRYWTPMQWDIFRKEQQLTDYFDIPEQVYQANKDKLALAAPSYTAYRTQADEEAGAKAAAEGLEPAYVGDQHYSYAWRQLQKWIAIERKRYLSNNPDKADLVIQLGYKPPSKVDIARRRMGIEEEPLSLPLPGATPSPLRPVGMPGR